MGLQRINHPAFFGTKREETIRFYRDVLGMELVLEQDNLDDPTMDHLFFHVGGDSFIAYFVLKPDAEELRFHRSRHGDGGMHHLAIDVDPDEYDTYLKRLKNEGIAIVGPVDRGYERSIYFKDPNGVRIELLTWHSPIPEGLRQADIIRRAQALRIARGAGHIEDEDIRVAIEQLLEARNEAGGAGG